jgi:pimeloyl-ACP methyl ester carboxylesterase
MQKPSIILLHGALGCSVQLQPLANELSAQFEVSMHDFPGHGANPHTVDFSMEGFAAFLKDALVAYRLPVYILGYSMGGYTALAAASRWTLPITGIITLGTKFAWDAHTGEREAARLNPDKMLEKVPDYAAYLAHMHGEAYWRQVVERTAVMLRKLGQTPLLTQQACEQVRVPVHLLLGELDNMVTPEETMQVDQWLPNSNYKMLPGAKHAIEQVDATILASQIAACFK